MAPDSWLVTRARLAGLTRSRPPDDPELAELRLKMKIERAEATRDEYAAYMLAAVTRLVAGAPPLTAEQIARVADVLKAAPREQVAM